MEKKPIELDFDFGFSFIEGEDEKVEQIQTQLVEKEKTIEELSVSAQQAVYSVRNAIQPFLNRLQENPKAEKMLWPNRANDVKNFQKKLDQLVEEQVKNLKV